MKKLFIILIILISLILLFTSCKLLSPDDTTPPEIQLSIAGGNEISRDIILYLEIEDDSKIDYVSVIIDDTTAITAESNFDTISFDVTPFADESEHILYATVEDSEGNIGESEKINVVITEYPGWRIYDIDFFNIPFGISHSPTLAPIVIDENGVIIIGSGWHYNGFFIFNPSTHDLQHFTMDNSPIPSNDVADIEYIGDGRIILASFDHILQYSYKLKRWIYSIDLPEFNDDNNSSDIYSIAVDRNYDVWAGTNLSGLFHYKGEVLNKWYFPPEIPITRVYDIVVSNNNTIYASTDGGGVFSISSDIINNFDNFPFAMADLVCISIDSSNIVWAAGDGTVYKYDGNNWNYVNTNIKFVPILVSSDGLLYTQDITGRGLVVGDGVDWTFFDDYDSPFRDDIIGVLFISRKSLAEAPNGDIWMVAGGKLMRYRPSLGGYP